jgi:SAM-dependent methyltransferase
MSWSDLSEVWLSELRSDPAYESVVTPLLVEVLAPEAGERYLDLGCGDGRVMRTLIERGAIAHGLDINVNLARRAGSAFVARLPAIPVRDDAYDGVYSVLSIEHVADHALVFTESARVTRSGGVMALVMNHPYWTAPGSTPITDTDGEVLWRPGDYFGDGTSSIPLGQADIVFHHRSMARLLNAAAAAGWRLEHMIEHSHHEIDEQSGIPRLLGCRWRLLP